LYRVNEISLQETDYSSLLLLLCSAIIGRNMELFKKHLVKFAYAMPAVCCYHLCLLLYDLGPVSGRFEIARKTVF